MAEKTTPSELLEKKTPGAGFQEEKPAIEETERTVQFSSVQSLSCVRLFASPWIAARQASLFITNSRSSLRLMSIESVMRSSHLILCRPLLLLPPIPPSIRVFSNESTQAQREPQICTSQDACTALGILQCWRPLVLLIHRELLLRLGNKYKHLSWLQI